MVVRGHIKNGMVVLDDPDALPEGTKVDVSPVETAKPPAEKPGEDDRTLLERLGNVVGAIKDAPPDLSTNLDHYLYGVPKRK